MMTGLGGSVTSGVGEGVAAGSGAAVTAGFTVAVNGGETAGSAAGPVRAPQPVIHSISAANRIANTDFIAPSSLRMVYIYQIIYYIMYWMTVCFPLSFIKHFTFFAHPLYSWPRPMI